MSPAHESEITFRLFTRRNVVLFLCSYPLVTGVASGSRVTFALGIFLFVLVTLEWIAGRRILGAITLQREHQPRAFEGDTVTVDIALENPSSRDTHLVEVVDSFSPGADYHVAHVATSLPGGEGVLFRYRRRCKRRRGLYIIGPLRLLAYSPLGVFEFRDTRDVVSTMLVYPQAADVRSFDMLGRGTLLEIGDAVVRRVGRGEQFARLRAYRPGDPPRYIHWPTSARRGTFLVKEFEQNVVTEITVYCDMHLIALAGVGDSTSIEFRVKTAASIATEAVRHHHMVRVVAVKDPVDMTTMAGGHEHIIAILDWLALLRAEGTGSFESYVSGEVEMLKRGSTAVLVLSSGNMDSTRTASLVQLLAIRRVRPICVIVDDRSFLKLRPEQDRPFVDALPLDDMVWLLKEAGAHVFTVLNQQNLSTQLGVTA